MLVTFLLQFMFACVGVQLFKVKNLCILNNYLRLEINIFRELFIHVMINQC
jgi:hypothetical protein